MSAALLALLLFQSDPLAPGSPVHPHRFGSPGGVGRVRGWYFWGSYDPKTGTAEAVAEGSGERVRTRVLPWLTSYRHLAYPGRLEELRAGERVNLFFEPDGTDRRAWLVHVQDEIGQMRGHGDAWEVERVEEGGRRFVAHAKDGKALDFERADGCREVRAGEKLYLTWCLEDGLRRAHLAVDEAGLKPLQEAAKARAADHVAREGHGALVEEGRLLVFASTWAQARFKAGDRVRVISESGTAEARVVSSKNLGTYGSGPTELVVDPPAAPAGRIVRVKSP